MHDRYSQERAWAGCDGLRWIEADTMHYSGYYYGVQIAAAIGMLYMNVLLRR